MLTADDQARISQKYVLTCRQVGCYRQDPKYLGLLLKSIRRSRSTMFANLGITVKSHKPASAGICTRSRVLHLKACLRGLTMSCNPQSVPCHISLQTPSNSCGRLVGPLLEGRRQGGRKLGGRKQEQSCKRKCGQGPVGGMLEGPASSFQPSQCWVDTSFLQSTSLLQSTHHWWAATHVVLGP